MSEDFDTKRERIEALMEDYAKASAEAEEWYRDWRARMGLPPIPVKKSDAA